MVAWSGPGRGNDIALECGCGADFIFFLQPFVRARRFWDGFQVQVSFCTGKTQTVILPGNFRGNLPCNPPTPLSERLIVRRLWSTGAPRAWEFAIGLRSQWSLSTETSNCKESRRSLDYVSEADGAQARQAETNRSRRVSEPTSGLEVAS